MSKIGDSVAESHSVAVLRTHCPDLDVEQVVDSLNVGLTRLRDLLLRRVHLDVEQQIGFDSLIAPVSLLTEQRQSETTKLEIEIYAIVVVADEIARQSYVDRSLEWLLVWLFQQRLGGEQAALFKQRLDYYKSSSPGGRRLKFLTLLQRAMPESRRTPLVLFRLFPRALRIVAATAFGQSSRARQLRAEQCGLLPAITDCHQCRGQVLDNDDHCQLCGNPVWEFAWLTSD